MSFFLVQRISHWPMRGDASPLEKMAAAGFGSGSLGDYRLDYMGSSEFEFGAVPKAWNRIVDRQKELTIGEHEFNGHKLHFAWLKGDGEPFDEWDAWARGEGRRRPCEGQETPFALAVLLGVEKPFGRRTIEEYRDEVAVWWALGESVMWAFRDSDERSPIVTGGSIGDSHLLRMLAGLNGGSGVKLR